MDSTGRYANQRWVWLGLVWRLNSDLARGAEAWSDSAAAARFVVAEIRPFGHGLLLTPKARTVQEVIESVEELSLLPA